MKVLLDSLHLNFHIQELYPIMSKLHYVSERVKYHLYHYPKLNDSFKYYFLTNSIYCIKCNSSYCILWKIINRFY